MSDENETAFLGSVIAGPGKQLKMTAEIFPRFDATEVS